MIYSERELLDIDPFSGGMDAPERIMADRFHTAVAKESVCTLCSGSIRIGDRYRKIAFVADGSFMAHKYCMKCCVAMLEETQDDELDESTVLDDEEAHGQSDLPVSDDAT